jgi:hypothetical protein
MTMPALPLARRPSSGLTSSRDEVAASTRAALADGDAQTMTSANEIRRMFTALCGPPPGVQHARCWSRWRQHHQEHAKRCHYQRQQKQDHQVRLPYK